MRELQDRGEGKVLFSPLTVRFDDINVHQPDVLFIRKERTPIIGEKFISGAPDLIIEVLSPSTRRRDLGRKAEIYARFGVPQYWIADPKAASMRILTLSGERYEIEAEGKAPSILRPRAFPRMRVPLAKVFAR